MVMRVHRFPTASPIFADLSDLERKSAVSLAAFSAGRRSGRRGNIPLLILQTPVMNWSWLRSFRRQEGGFENRLENDCSRSAGSEKIRAFRKTHDGSERGRVREFTRVIELPHLVDADKVSANCPTEY